MDTHEQQDAQLESRPRVGPVLPHVKRPVREEPDPTNEPGDLAPTQGRSNWNEEAGDQERAEEQCRRQTPCRPCYAPYPKRCLDEGRHTNALLRSLSFGQQENRGNVGNLPTYQLNQRGGNWKTNSSLRTMPSSSLAIRST